MSCNVMYISRKTVPGGWTGVAETTFSEFGSSSWQKVSLSLLVFRYVSQLPQPVSAASLQRLSNIAGIDRCT